MATAEQVKALVRAYADENDEKFKTVVLQIASHEAKSGHDRIAHDLKTLVDRIEARPDKIVQFNSNNQMFERNLSSHRFSELVINDDLSVRLRRIVDEYKSRNKLRSYGLSNRRKILLEGRSGTGKTLSAQVIATELSLPLYVVQMDKLITKFMGETSVKLRQIFDSIESMTGVYLFDEFDAIGADRSLDNEVGEMRRILNSFLQFIEQDTSDSIVIAATNNPNILDQALFRRFDDVLHYSMPTDSEIKILFVNRLQSYDERFRVTDKLVTTASGLSHAEVTRVCEDAIKDSILSDRPITERLLIELIKQRQAIQINLK